MLGQCPSDELRRCDDVPWRWCGLVFIYAGGGRAATSDVGAAAAGAALLAALPLAYCRHADHDPDDGGAGPGYASGDARPDRPHAAESRLQPAGFAGAGTA